MAEPAVVYAEAKRSKYKPQKKGFFFCVKRHWEIYLMLLIPLIFILIFSYGPMAGLIISGTGFFS